MKTIIKNGYVVSMDPKIGEVKNCDVIVEDGKILQIGVGLEVDGAKVIDANNCIVLPGFVDVHRHNWQTQLRSVASDWTLFDYLTKIRSTYSAFYSEEDAYIGNYAGALESLNAGITTIVDHCHLINSPKHADRLVDGLEDAGIRAIFCYGFFVNPKYNPYSLENDPGWRYKDAERVKAERFKSDDALLLFGVNPSEYENTPPEKVKEELALCRKLGAKIISCHVGMGFYDIGTHIVSQLGKAGLLSDDMLFVHGAALTDEELEMIRESGGAIVSTPETELQMGMGYPVAFRALDHGVKASIGLDIISNYSAEMFTQMRILLQTQRAMENMQVAQQHRMAPGKVRRNVKDILYLATQGGADAINMGDVIGSITPGKRADLIMIRTDELNMAPVVDDPIGSVVYYANPSNIDTVMVDGVLKKANGQLVDVDIPAIVKKVSESRKEIDAQYAQIDPSFNVERWKKVFNNCVYLD